MYDRAGVLPLTDQLAKQQLNLLGCVARSEKGSPLRRDTSISDTMQPTISHFIRKVGRPRINSTQSVLKDGAERFNGQLALSNLICTSTKDEWKSHLNRIFAKAPASYR